LFIFFQRSVTELGYKYGFRWQSWAILFAFLVSNVVFSFGMTWLMRIRPLSR